MNVINSGLHIINGWSAGATWQQTFHQKDRLVLLQDWLSHGPILPSDNLTEWIKIRATYLLENLYPDWEEIYSGLYSDLLDNLDRLKQSETIFLWAATGIDDQLFILFAINIFEKNQIDINRIRIIQFEKIDYKPQSFSIIYSMGEVNPKNMANFPMPVALNQTEFAYIKSAWAALTSSTPEALQNFVSIGNSPLPYVQKTMQNILLRYPTKATGLTYWDWKLLQNVQQYSPNTLRVIGHTIAGDIWLDRIHIDDAYLFFRLRQLSSDRKPQPLIKLAGNLYDMRETTVSLTEFGRLVVEGKASSYPINPIDEWIGGVHLSSDKNNIWFYDDIKT